MINQYTDLSKLDEETKEENVDKEPLSVGIKIIFYIGLCLVSLGMVLYGVLAFTSSLNSMKFKNVEAVVRDESSRKNIYVVDYVIDEKSYSGYCKITKDVKPKDKITVYYNPKEKEEVIYKKSVNIIGILVAIVGLFLFKIGITKSFNYFKEAKVYFKEEDTE